MDGSYAIDETINITQYSKTVKNFMISRIE